jgi:hypothetical protein
VVTIFLLRRRLWAWIVSVSFIGLFCVAMALGTLVSFVRMASHPSLAATTVPLLLDDVAFAATLGCLLFGYRAVRSAGGTAGS